MSLLSFTLVQTNLIWENKDANLKLLEEKINAINKPTHIVILRDRR